MDASPFYSRKELLKDISRDLLHEISIIKANAKCSMTQLLVITVANLNSLL